MSTSVSPHSDKIFPCLSLTEDSFWTYTPAFSYINCTASSKSYLGGYGAGASIQSTYPTRKAHRGIAIGFHLALIDSWDNETFIVTADGETVFTYTHSYLSSMINTCQNAWADNEIEVRFGFNHSADNLTLVLTSDLDSNSTDEAWGICDLTIDLLTGYADKYGNDIGVIKPMTFLCSLPERDNDWSYVPAYKTVYCSHRHFVGGYGAGEAIKTALYIPHDHAALTIAFKLVLIGSWDSDTSFVVNVDGVAAYNYTYDESTSYSFYADDNCSDTLAAHYVDVKFGLNHTASSIELTFASTLQEGSDNAWGVCDVWIHPYERPVTISGYAYGLTITTMLFSSFTSLVSPFWHYIPRYNLVNCAGTPWLGPFGEGGEASVFITYGASHQAAFIHFQLALFDSWENETFYVKVDDKVVYSYTHTHDPLGSNTCMSHWNDKFISVTVGLNLTKSSITIVMTSDLDEPAENESWGVYMFTSWPSTAPIAPEGGSLNYLKAPVFSCIAPVYDPDWTYTPTYETFKCNGNTYVAGHSSGGYLNVTYYFQEKHHGILMKLNLALTSAWGNNTFYVYADETLVYSFNYYYNSTTNGGEPVNFDLAFGFNHSSFTLMLAFGSDVEGDADEVAWGICEVDVVKTVQDVDSTGLNELNAAKNLTLRCEDPGLDLAWTYAPTYQTVAVSSGDYYVGPFVAGGNMYAKLGVASEHLGIVMSFKLAVFGAWEGEEFFVVADNNLVYLTKYETDTLSSDSESSFEEDEEVRYLDITFGFNHTAGSLYVHIESSLKDYNNGDKSWGICDLSIIPTTAYVNVEGNTLE